MSAMSAGAPAPVSLGKRILNYLITQKPDQFFLFLRLPWPNLRIPKEPVFVTRYQDVQEEGWQGNW